MAIFIPRWWRWKDKWPSGNVDLNYNNALAKNIKSLVYAGRDIARYPSTPFVSTIYNDGYFKGTITNAETTNNAPIATFAVSNIIYTSNNSYILSPGGKVFGSKGVVLFREQSTSKILFDLRNSSNSPISSTTTFSVPTQLSCLGTSDGVTRKLYVNGVLEASSANVNSLCLS